MREWCHRHGDVPRERPRRGRPHEQTLLAVCDRQLQIDARVDHVAVAERHLVRGQRGLAARAVGDDPVALVQQAALVDLRERPPHRLDVALIQRAVGVLEVDPEADPLGQAVPLLHVREHRLAAAFVELADAVLLDFGLGADAELFFNGELHG